jgi:hypothetical protein
MKKRDLQIIIEAQAAEIAELRRRIEALEARPTIAVTPSERVAKPERNPWRPLMPYEVEPPEDTGTRRRG